MGAEQIIEVDGWWSVVAVVAPGRPRLLGDRWRKWRSQKDDCWTYVEFRVTQLSTKLVVFENSFVEVI